MSNFKRCDTLDCDGFRVPRGEYCDEHGGTLDAMAENAREASAWAQGAAIAIRERRAGQRSERKGRGRRLADTINQECN